MILINIAQRGRHARTDAEVQAATAEAWVAADNAIQQHDTVLAVYRNVVRGAYRIRSSSRRKSDGRVVLDLEPDPSLAAEWVGEEPPVRFVRGQANPIRYYEPAG